MKKAIGFDCGYEITGIILQAIGTKKDEIQNIC